EEILEYYKWRRGRRDSLTNPIIQYIYGRMGKLRAVFKTFIMIAFLAACAYPAHAQTEEPAGPRVPLREKVKTAAVMPFSSKSSLSAEMPAEALSDKERFLMISFYDALVAQGSVVKITPLKESE